jgi:peptide/nickel transport system substrate-binding protein
VASPFTRLCSLLAIVCAAVAGCTAPAPSGDDKPARGGEIVASLRSEPRSSYLRYLENSAAVDLVSLLTEARLIHVDRTTDRAEPGLAESWTASPDGLTHTFKLRPTVTFSDGVPFTSADVLFAMEVAYGAPGSQLAASLTLGGKQLTATAPDPLTVVVAFPEPFSPGVRVFENLPIIPRHKLGAALAGGTLTTAWGPGKPLTEMAGLGPFVLTEHVSGQRMVFTRNPHYWRRDANGQRLPYLDKITVLIIAEQGAEALRMESGGLDLMSNGDIRPEDYSRFKRLADQGRLSLIDGGTGVDPNLLWFNLAPAKGRDAKPWLRRREFRLALSHAVDRQALANSVYLGEAIPLHGPVSPGNKVWYSPAAPTYPYDPARSKELLRAAGLTDRDGDGTVEDAAGRPARFSMIVQQGHSLRERTAAVLQEQFRRIGVGVDLVGLDPPSIGQRFSTGSYESIYFGFQASSLDPGMNLDFWLSGGNTHVWNPGQKTPSTPWEKQIDDLMLKQIAAPTLEERQRIFAEVQRIFGEHVPALYFIVPKVTLAVSTRLRNPKPSPQIPQLLWSADTLAVSTGRQ